MWAYIFQRLLLMVPTLFGVITLTFVVTQFVPGGPVEQIVMALDNDGRVNADTTSGSFNYVGRKGVDDEQVRQLTASYGFDKPLFERYVDTVSRMVRFDLGYSYFRQQGVWELILSKLPVSISLGFWTFLLTYLVSVPLGITKAVRAGSRFDLITSLVVLIGYAIPSFVLGVVLIVLFGGGSFWDLFPLRGLVSDDWARLGPLDRVLDYLWHVTLPVVAMVVSSFAIKTMLTKNSFLEEIRRQYVLTARAKGLSERQVLWKHVLRNAVIPLVTGFPAAFIAAFFTGSILIESLFSLDGLGLLSFESINTRDYPVVLGTLYLFTLIGLLTKLIGDLGYVLVDPRIKFTAQEH
ncbi:ABC transporter permease subunit [Thauera sinica]|uniref:ABC transporter permease subunit n=2 Tax=Thauera TaxID=33057 RepID=A0ABW1AMG4_9RHOO|nr:microcin ABC transporter permease [Thauera sp. K11]